MMRKYARRAACTLFLALTIGSSAAWANPLGIAWNTTTNVGLYGKPTGMLIAGRCNVYDPAFAAARKKGAEVLMYLAAVERPDARVCALDTKFYMNDLGRVPLWPYPTYGQRINWATAHMTDMRPGSQWILHVVKYIEGLMREGKVDGVFLDTVGARPWSKLTEWNTWTQAEKNAWTDGNIDLVRRLDAKRRAINPYFIIVNNNVWDRGDSRGLAGERYVDGVVLEHPKAGSAWHVKYAGKAFGDLGQRRVLVIANSRSEAQQWIKVPGVTHVSDQTTAQYKFPNPPAVPFSYRGDRDQ
jgi:hypothetical protein